MGKIRLKTRMAGPGGNYRAGQVINVSAETQEALVAGGYAESADTPVVEIATKSSPEQATGKRQRKSPPSRSRSKKTKEKDE